MPYLLQTPTTLASVTAIEILQGWLFKDGLSERDQSKLVFYGFFFFNLDPSSEPICQPQISYKYNIEAVRILNVHHILNNQH